MLRSFGRVRGVLCFSSSAHPKYFASAIKSIPFKSSNWYSISGFPSFASRRDLLATIGNVQPSNIDPVVDNWLMFTGAWLLQFESLEQLTAVAACLDANEESRRHIKLQPAPKEGLRSSSVGISSSVVRAVMHHKCDLEYLSALFLPYRLQSVIPVSQHGVNSKDLLLSFATREDAERAARDFALGDKMAIKGLTWFDC